MWGIDSEWERERYDKMIRLLDSEYLAHVMKKSSFE
jgi:hypothetical protein